MSKKTLSVISRYLPHTSLAALLIAISTQATALTIGYATDATFTDPAPAGATTSGVDTSAFTWGIPLTTADSVSSLTFTGTSATASLPGTGVPFLFGTIAFFNGTLSDGSEATSVDLSMSAYECDTDLGPCSDTNFIAAESTFDTLGITINNTSNIAGDDIASADSFCMTLLGDLSPTCAWALEGSSSLFDAGSSPIIEFEIWAALGSIKPTKIVPVSAGAFTTLAVVNADGTFTYDPTVNVIDSVPIPEPSVLALMGLGLLGLGFYTKKRKV